MMNERMDKAERTVLNKLKRWVYLFYFSSNSKYPLVSMTWPHACLQHLRISRLLWPGLFHLWWWYTCFYQPGHNGSNRYPVCHCPWFAWAGSFEHLLMHIQIVEAPFCHLTRSRNCRHLFLKKMKTAWRIPGPGATWRRLIYYEIS